MSELHPVEAAWGSPLSAGFGKVSKFSNGTSIYASVSGEWGKALVDILAEEPRIRFHDRGLDKLDALNFAPNRAMSFCKEFRCVAYGFLR
jgi:hypothetical protein